jgi:hypothetical protein
MTQPADRQEEREHRAQEQAARAPQPPPAVQAESLMWASAVGNQAVQRLARQHAATAEEEPPTVAPEEAPGEEAAPPAEADEAEEALAPGEPEALAAVDDDAETLPE